MKKIVFLLLSCCLLFSCSDKARLHRLQSRHPEWFKQDTIFKTITITEPAIKIDTSFKAPADTVGILRMVDSILAQGDSGKALHKTLSQTLRLYAYLPTPQVVEKDGTTVTVSAKDGIVNLTVAKPEREIQRRVPVSVDSTITPCDDCYWTLWKVIAVAVVAFVLGYIVRHINSK